MEEFLLRGVLAGDELNIVHEEEVGVAVFVAELDVLAARCTASISSFVNWSPLM